MKFIVYLLLSAFILGAQIPAFAVVGSTSGPENLTVEQKQKLSEAKAKVNNFSEKKKARLKKRIEKFQAKFAKKSAISAAPADTSGVKLGLIIVLVGVVIALLGFAGIADILVTIGLVVLVVGLLLWLLGYL